LGIETLHQEHLDHFIMAGLTWEEYRATPAPYHAGRTTWWRRKRALIAQGEPVKTDRELLRGARREAGSQRRFSPASVVPFQDDQTRNIRYAAYLLSQDRVGGGGFLSANRKPYQLQPIKVEGEVCVVPVLGSHVLAWAADLQGLVRITNALMGTPNLYLCVLGDAKDLLAGLRTKLARYEQAAAGNGGTACKVLETWISWVEPRILFVTSRDPVTGRGIAQDASGSPDRAPWQVISCNPVAYARIKVGIEEYSLAASRSLRRYSMRSALSRAVDALENIGVGPEIILLEETRSTGTLLYRSAGREKLIMTCGRDALPEPGVMALPCFTLDAGEHRVIPYPSVGLWLQGSGGRTAAGGTRKPPDG
jgi:hypothetical protein